MTIADIPLILLRLNAKFDTHPRRLFNDVAKHPSYSPSSRRLCKEKNKTLQLVTFQSFFERRQRQKTQLFKYKLAGSCSLDWTRMNSHRERFDDKVSIDIYRKRRSKQVRPWRRREKEGNFSFMLSTPCKKLTSSRDRREKRFKRVIK